MKFWSSVHQWASDTISGLENGVVSSAAKMLSMSRISSIRESFASEQVQRSDTLLPMFTVTHTPRECPASVMVELGTWNGES